MKNCRGKLGVEGREARHLISHLCNVKPSGRYSSTEALEHPWITGIPKTLLSYDEKLVLQPLKSAVLAILFTVKAKNTIPKLKPRRKYTDVEAVPSGEIEFRAAQEKIKRRDWYAKKVKLMQGNPPLYHAIYGNKINSPTQHSIPTGKTSRTTSSKELPVIKEKIRKEKFASIASLKSVDLEKPKDLLTVSKSVTSHRGPLREKKLGEKLAIRGKKNVWKRLSEKKLVFDLKC